MQLTQEAENHGVQLCIALINKINCVVFAFYCLFYLMPTWQALYLDSCVTLLT